MSAARTPEAVANLVAGLLWMVQFLLRVPSLWRAFRQIVYADDSKGSSHTHAVRAAEPSGLRARARFGRVL